MVASTALGSSGENVRTIWCSSFSKTALHAVQAAAAEIVDRLQGRAVAPQLPNRTANVGLGAIRERWALSSCAASLSAAKLLAAIEQRA